MSYRYEASVIAKFTFRPLCRPASSSIEAAQSHLHTSGRFRDHHENMRQLTAESPRILTFSLSSTEGRLIDGEIMLDCVKGKQRWGSVEEDLCVVRGVLSASQANQWENDDKESECGRPNVRE